MRPPTPAPWLKATGPRSVDRANRISSHRSRAQIPDDRQRGGRESRGSAPIRPDPPRSAPIRTGSGRSGGRIATAAAPPNCTGPDLRMFVKATRAAAAPKQTSMYEHVRSTPAGPGRSLERQLTVVVAPSLIHGCWHQTTAGGLQNPDQDRHYRMFSMARRPFNAINPTLERQLTVVVAPAGGSINCSCASWTGSPPGQHRIDAPGKRVGAPAYRVPDP